MSNKPTRFSFTKKLQELLPGKTISILDEEVIIRPLRLKNLNEVMGLVDKMSDDMIEAGITSENFQDPANIVKIVQISFKKAPNFLEEISNVATEDLLELELNDVAKIAMTAIEVNVDSFESLSKNWTSLTEKMKSLPFAKTLDKEKKAEQKK